MSESEATLEVYSIIPCDEEQLKSLGQIVKEYGGRNPTVFSSKTGPGAIVVLPAAKREQFIKNPQMQDKTIRHHRTFMADEGFARTVPPAEQLLKSGLPTKGEKTKTDVPPERSLSFKDALMKDPEEKEDLEAEPELRGGDTAEDAALAVVAEIIPNAEAVSPKEAEAIRQLEAAASVPAKSRPDHPEELDRSPAELVAEVEATIEKSGVKSAAAKAKAATGQSDVKSTATEEINRTQDYNDPVLSTWFWMAIFLAVVLVHMVGHFWGRFRKESSVHH